MKVEKIQKHMLRRTVVVAHYGDELGVITRDDRSDVPVLVEGMSRENGDMWECWCVTDHIRKATDAERAEFFAWLVKDGRDIADGFQRFGGMPRGFEAWRAAQDARHPADAFAVGQRVRIVKGGGDVCLRGFVDGNICEVVHPDTGGEHRVMIRRRELRGFARPDQLELVADEPTPQPVTAPHKVGDLRVRLTYDGFGEVGRVAEVDEDGDVYLNGACRPKGDVFDPTPENVARLVAEQRERGIKPEAGDLVFVLHGGVVSTAVVAHNLSDAQASLLLQGAMCGGGAISWGLSPDLDAQTLVIRRCPFRGVEDV